MEHDSQQAGALTQDEIEVTPAMVRAVVTVFEDSGLLMREAEGSTEVLASVAEEALRLALSTAEKTRG